MASNTEDLKDVERKVEFDWLINNISWHLTNAKVIQCWLLSFA